MVGSLGSLFARNERFRRRGLSTPFSVCDGSHVLCGSCRRINPVGFLRLLHLDAPAPASRSDVTLAVVQCGECHERGTLPLSPLLMGLTDEQVLAGLREGQAPASTGLPDDAAFA